MKISITFIIATYNRAQDLSRALESFLVLSQPDRSMSWEVIVVDNNSDDNTVQIVENFNNKLPVSYLKENRAGVSYARNCGAEHSKSDYLVFLDDDARITEDYLKILMTVLERQPDVFGGPIYPYYLQQKPEWFKDEFEIRNHHPDTGWIPSSSGSLLSSSNMGFSKQFFDNLGGFNTELGPKGNLFALGEDGEIILRAKKNRGKIYYDHNLVMEHLVPSYKFNIVYQIYRSHEHGVANVFLDSTDNLQSENIWDMYYSLSGGLDRISKMFSDNSGQLQDDKFNHEVFFIEEVIPQLRHIFYHQARIRKKRENRSVGEKLMNMNLFTLKNSIKGVYKQFLESI